MSDSLVFTVTKEQLESLAHLAPQPLSPISPLRSAGAAPPAAPAAFSDGLGLTHGGGNPTVIGEHALSVLASAQAYARVHVKEASQLLEQALFFDPAGGTSVCLTTQGERLRVEDPAPVPVLLEGLKQMAGESVLKSSDVKTVLRPEEALLLAAALDSERRRFLLAFGMLEVPPETPQSAAGLLGLAKGTPLNTQWLSFAVRGIYRDEVALDASGAEAACQSLVKAGHLTAAKGGYLLSEPMQKLAVAHPIFERILHVEAGRVTPGGQVVFVGFSCLQAGVQDILYLEKTPEGLVLEAVSSGEMHQLVYQLVARHDALAALAQKVELEQPQTQKFDPAQATMVMASGDLPVLRLQAESGPLKGQTLILGDGSVIGRQAGVSVVLEDARISRRHAEFHRSPEGKWTLSDLGSANGTFLNDQRVKEPVVLNPKDGIRLADSVFRVMP